MSALGIHLLVSLFFVVGTVIEFGIVLGLKKFEDAKENTITAGGSYFGEKLHPSKGVNLESKEQSNNAETHNNRLSHYSTTEMIDLTAFIYK